MQIKKAEIRQEILDKAMNEFLIHGYERSSMRVIAKKANTTLGNIYHYFPNKEALLVELVTPPLNALETMINSHIEYAEEFNQYTKEELGKFIEEMEMTQIFPGLEVLFDKRIIILLELESGSLIVRRDKLLKHFKDHISEHLNLNEAEAPYSEILVRMIIDCLKHALLDTDSVEAAKAEFIKLFRFFCMGITIHNH